MNLSFSNLINHQSRAYIGAMLLVIIVVGSLRVNNALYYDLALGYDAYQHTNNVFWIMRTGEMPPPPLQPKTYEAFQAPLFYVLSAWFLQAGQHPAIEDVFNAEIPLLLFMIGMSWIILIADFVLRYLRRIPLILRILIICLVLLIPTNTIMSTMFNNDMPVTILGAVAIWTLWLMCRSNQLTSRRLWFRVAALTGIATLIKLSGMIIIATYCALAGYVVVNSIWKKQLRKARRVLVAASIGLPLMLFPWAFNTLHTLQYVDNTFGVTVDTRDLWEVVTPNFFLSFDFNIFDMPFAFQAGAGSYWSLQFLTLHNDYYNHWNSAAYETYPSHELIAITHRDPMPILRFKDAVTLLYLALPVSMIMLFGLFISLYRVVLRNQFAIRDGSVLVLFYAVIAQVAQFVRFAQHPDIRGVIIHARHLGFVYAFLFIVGSWWLIRLTEHHKWKKQIRLVFATLMFAYCSIAYRLMWLPPVELT